jgi:hypothetical protein
MGIWCSNIHVGLLVTHLVVNMLHICPFMVSVFSIWGTIINRYPHIFSIRWFRFRCIDFSLSVSFSNLSFPYHFRVNKNTIGNDNAYFFIVSDRFHP